MPRRVTFTEEARQALRSLHIHMQRPIKAYLKKLALLPDPGKELVDELTGYRSVQIGKYRAIFTLTDAELRVHTVGHRRNVYEDARQLLDHRTPTARADERA